MRTASSIGAFRRVLDTNILVYQHDPSDPSKQRIAIEVVARAGAVGQTALTTQVLAEFAWTAMRRLPLPLTAAQAGRQVGLFARAFGVLPVTTISILEALRAVDEYQLSFWDAMIWGVARLNHVPLVLSEDLPGGGRAIEEVRYANPFDPAFDIAWVGGDL